jgi:hypothetical protein
MYCTTAFPERSCTAVPGVRRSSLLASGILKYSSTNYGTALIVLCILVFPYVQVLYSTPVLRFGVSQYSVLPCYQYKESSASPKQPLLLLMFTRVGKEAVEVQAEYDSQVW